MPQAPPPARIRKISEQSIAKSVRASLTMNQKPWVGRVSSGSLVVTMAVVMMIKRGREAARVQRPMRTRKPQIDFECTDEMRGEVGVEKSRCV